MRKEHGRKVLHEKFYLEHVAVRQKKTMPIGAFIYFILIFWTVFPLVGFRISVWIDVIHDQRRRMG